MTALMMVLGQSFVTFGATTVLKAFDRFMNKKWSSYNPREVISTFHGIHRRIFSWSLPWTVIWKSISGNFWSAQGISSTLALTAAGSYPGAYFARQRAMYSSYDEGDEKKSGWKPTVEFENEGDLKYYKKFNLWLNFYSFVIGTTIWSMDLTGIAFNDIYITQEIKITGWQQGLAGVLLLQAFVLKVKAGRNAAFRVVKMTDKFAEKIRNKVGENTFIKRMCNGIEVVRRPFITSLRKLSQKLRKKPLSCRESPLGSVPTQSQIADTKHEKLLLTMGLALVHLWTLLEERSFHSNSWHSSIESHCIH